MKRMWTAIVVGLVVLLGICGTLWYTHGLEGIVWHRTVTRYGFIDKTGTFVIEPQFSVVGNFSEGLAVVATSGRDKRHPEHEHSMYMCGYIDKTGAYVIPPQFQCETFAMGGQEFRNGTAVIEDDFKIYRIDRSGKILEEVKDSGRPPRLEYDLGSGFKSFKERGKWGLEDQSGTIVVSPTYQMIRQFREGLAAVRLNNKCGFIDATGKVVLGYQFDDARLFSEGLAAVNIGAYPGEHADSSSISGGYVGGAWGYIDKTGTMVIAPQFSAALEFENGRAAVNMGAGSGSLGQPVGGKWGFIDRSGAWIVEPRYNDVRYSGEGMVAVNEGAGPDPGGFPRGGKWGYLNAAGEHVVAPQYDYAFEFHDGLAYVSSNGKGGVVDKEGNVVIPPKFKHVHPFSEGLAAASVEGRYDIRGKFHWR